MFVFITLCYLLLWTTATTLAQNEPGFFVSAPDMIRVGVAEKVLISVHNTGNSVIPVRLLLQSYPDKSITYADQEAFVDKDHPEVLTLEVDPRDVEIGNKDTKQFTVLVVKAEAPNFVYNREKRILLSFKTGYVFVQTDKPIYTPDHDVRIRVISLDQDMKPSTLPIKLEIRNPQNIIVRQIESVTAETGFITESFHFPSHPLFGNWSVVAHYGHRQLLNTTVKFHVREYVLPTFSIEVKPDRPYILPDGVDLPVDILAITTFGKPVRGNYFIKYSVMHDGVLHQLGSESGKLENDGRALPVLKTSISNTDWAERYHDDNNNDWAETILGKHLRIHVSITEEASGNIEGANNTQVLFVNTPYRFQWDKTARYFKKGLPFEVKAVVQYANGRPGFNIPVNAVATANTGARGQVSLTPVDSSSLRGLRDTQGEITFTVNVPEDAVKIRIELHTDDSIIDTYNAHAAFDVNPQQPSISGNYLSVQILEKNIEAGDTIPVELKKTGSATGNTTLYMFVLSKGQIVNHKTVSSATNTIDVDLYVTYDMIPHARLLAYYIDESNQVVADSVWFDVMHDCDNDVSVQTQDRQLDYKPKDQVELNIEGLPGTQVGLLAIDSSVYLLEDNDKLTEEKLRNTMSDYDLGCGAGGGIDAQAVFMDSGVTVITSANLDTDVRQDETCSQATARRKRDVANQLSTQYDHSSELQTFCNDGASEHWLNATACVLEAETQATVNGLSVDDERIQAFYNCCMIVHYESAEEGDSEEDHVRSDFPETWIFDQVEIDNTGQAVYSIATPDSATTWIVQAIGVSSSQGMCVARPVKVKVQPDFFIQVHMPPAVVRNEQVEIVATVSNFLDHTLYKANVSLLGVESICSETPPGEWSGIRMFDIPPGDSVVVKFNVVPLKVGEFPLEIRVVTSQGKDAVRETLKVVPEGIVRTHILQIPLNPTGSNHQATNASVSTGTNSLPLTHENIPTGHNHHQRDHIDITLPGGAVPDSASLSIHVTGSLMGRMITAVIEGRTLTSDLDVDHTNGEIVAADTAANVFVLKYLKETGQLTANVTHRLKQNIESGITTQETHRRQNSGAFAYMPYARDSAWLTAFVNKIFCQAREFHFVDPEVTSTAMDWLINNAQQSDGSFQEVRGGGVHVDNMKGALVYEDETLGNHVAAKTAYVLISLMECNHTAMANHVAVNRATAYLESVYRDLIRPFDKAIVTYALTLVGSDDKEDANQRLRNIAICDEDTCHWEEDRTHGAYTSETHWNAVVIETTGYALLAQLTLGEIDYSHAIVNWLSQHAGFTFTQDTVVALQALSEYAIWKNEQTYINLQTTITSSHDGDFSHSVHINEGNALLQQTIKGPVDGQLVVDTRGEGSGQLAVQIKYHTVDESFRTCPFDIRIQADEGEDPNPPQRLRRSIQKRSSATLVSFVNVCTKYASTLLPFTDVDVGVVNPLRYLGNAQSSNMAVIDVGLYSGFRPYKDTLIELQENDPRIQRYEITNRSVIFFVDEIPSSESLCLSFQTIRDYVVGQIQPVAVRVYDYHQPERDCVKFYHQASGPSMVARVCEGQTCMCAEGNCPSRPCEADVCTSSCQDLLGRLRTGNSSDVTRQSTFAYKVRFNRRKINAGFEIVYMNISQAIVIGDDEALMRSFETNPNQVVERPFWLSRNCKQRLGLRIGTKRTYLVIGTGGMRYRDDNGHESFKYILDDTYIFEDWPEGSRARRDAFMPQLEKLETLKTAIEQGRDCSTG